MALTTPPINEVVYLDRDNTFVEFLSTDRLDVDFSAVTRIDLIAKRCVWEVFSITTPGIITWEEKDGGLEVTFKLGSLDLVPREYTCSIIVYDPSNPEGVVWGELDVNIKSECRG